VVLRSVGQNSPEDQAAPSAQTKGRPRHHTNRLSKADDNFQQQRDGENAKLPLLSFQLGQQPLRF
jgi:hypothetical protein